LRRAGYALHTTAEFEIVKHIKEKYCVVEPFSSATSINPTPGVKDPMGDNRFSIKKDEAFVGDNRFSLKKDAQEKERTNELGTYMLPDGQNLKIGSEKKVAPEILFRPELIGLEYPGVHEMVANCIYKCDIDLRKQLFSNIIVAGSTTLMRDFCDRLHKQIAKLSKESKPTLIAPNNR
jgi:centractin